MLLRGDQRRPGARAAALVPGARLPAAVHRADAARRPARLEPRGHDHRRRDLRLAAAPSSAWSRPRSRGAARPPSCSPSTAARSTVGVIASVTRPFCGDCDRVRLTADGQVRNCLFAREESDLRAALRGGADDAEIADRWRAAMMTKRPGPRHRRHRRSCSPRARCRPSAADPARRAADASMAGAAIRPAVARAGRMPGMRSVAAIAASARVLEEAARARAAAVAARARTGGAATPPAGPVGGQARSRPPPRPRRRARRRPERRARCTSR